MLGSGGGRAGRTCWQGRGHRRRGGAMLEDAKQPAADERSGRRRGGAEGGEGVVGAGGRRWRTAAFLAARFDDGAWNGDITRLDVDTVSAHCIISSSSSARISNISLSASTDQPHRRSRRRQRTISGPSPPTHLADSTTTACSIDWTRAVANPGRETGHAGTRRAARPCGQAPFRECMSRPGQPRLFRRHSILMMVFALCLGEYNCKIFHTINNLQTAASYSLAASQPCSLTASSLEPRASSLHLQPPALSLPSAFPALRPASATTLYNV
jgi:hypothetical protein